MKYYVAVKKNYHCDIIRSQIVPTQLTHGNKYLFCYGNYPTVKKCIQVAMYHNLGIDTPQDKSILA